MPKKSYKRRLYMIAGAMVLVGLSAIVITSIYGNRSASASPAIDIRITDPDDDDIGAGRIRVREGPGGALSAKIELNLNGVTVGNTYTINVEVTEDPGEMAEVETPPLTATFLPD